MSAQSQIFNPTLRTSQASGDGFSCPVMNTASRLTLNFGVSDKGMMVYDTTISNVMYWTGTVWLPLGGGGLVPVGASLNTEVIYNNAGFLEGDAGLTFNNTTNALTVAGPATVQGLTLGKGASAIGTNTAFGNNALADVTIAQFSTAIGYLALDALTTGDRNTAIGANSLGSVTIGTNNTGVGMISFTSVVSGLGNTGVGDLSAWQATGSYNSAIGSQSLQILLAGDNNTAIGFLAGYQQISGSNNGFFGAYSYGDSNTASNSYNYGNSSVTSHKFRNGNVVLGAGNVVLASAQGIDFSATAGTGTSELFDDYEEGTWVPTDVSGAGLAITGSNCSYTKIGRIVTIEGLIVFPANASAATAAIGGLPFNNANILGLNPQYGSEATLAFLYGGPTSTIALYTIAQTLITNATMSNDSFFLSGTYTAAT